MCHGGPFDEPSNVGKALKMMPGIVGFYGASSTERLPTERAIKAQVESFKALKLLIGQRRRHRGAGAVVVPRRADDARGSCTGVHPRVRRLAAGVVGARRAPPNPVPAHGPVRRVPNAALPTAPPSHPGGYVHWGSRPSVAATISWWVASVGRSVDGEGLDPAAPPVAGRPQRGGGGREDSMRSDRFRWLALALWVIAVLVPHVHARFEWWDVVQDVRILADGTVEVRDERTLWTDEDFGEAFLCVQLRPHERLSLIEGETAALSPGPAAVGLAQPCAGGTEVVVRQEVRVQKRRVRFAYRIEHSLDAYGDVVQWYWNILEQDRPAVRGYRLTVRIPGAMEAPFDAFVMRYANPEEPLSRSATTAPCSASRWTGCRPATVSTFGTSWTRGSSPSRASRLEALLRDQARISRSDE
jgi:hypothetical protein